MIVLTSSTYKHKGKSIIRAIATDWKEFSSMITDTTEYRDVSVAVIRDRPTFKKGGHDHLRIDVSTERGVELTELLTQEPFNGLHLPPRTYELASYHLKESRLKRDKEWNPEIRAYMRKGERSRMVALLKEGEWLNPEKVRDKGSMTALLDWQERLRSIPLGRNSHLRYAPGQQKTKYISRDAKTQALLGLEQEELFAHCVKIDYFKPYLDVYPDNIYDVITIKMKQGKITRENRRQFADGPIEDLY